MKNILNTEKNLELFDENGNKVYAYNRDLNGYSFERTYNENGNELTYKDSKGFSYKRTYDEKGKQLTYSDSTGIKRGF